jgi:type II secretory pathway component PulJ
MWRAAAIFLVVLPIAGLTGWWIFYRAWRRTPVGQAKRLEAERVEAERVEETLERLRHDRRSNGGGGTDR